MSLNLSAKQRILYDIIYSPLIGKKIEVIESNNANLIGICGEIVFESAQFLHVQTNLGEKKLKKNQITVSLEFEGELYSLNCSLLNSTLSVRLKKFKL